MAVLDLLTHDLRFDQQRFGVGCVRESRLGDTCQQAAVFGVAVLLYMAVFEELNQEGPVLRGHVRVILLVHRQRRRGFVHGAMLFGLAV